MLLNVDLSGAKPGMILAENIFLGGKLLLAKGSIIRTNHINRLKDCGIFQMVVYEEEMRYEEEIFSDNPVEEFYEKACKEIGKIIEQLKTNPKINLAHVFSLTENILDTVYKNKDHILLLTGYKSSPDIYLHNHSQDVCIYSLLAAKAIGLSYDESINLGIGALLHDIGKTKISEQILSKRAKLMVDEFEEVKKHPIYGYYMLQNIPQLDPAISRIVLEHHERCNGSGYPNNLRSEEIGKLSKIVAVADIYDALTSDRVYKKKVLPHEAAEYLLSISTSQLDFEITKVFLQNIAIYPNGCQVLLNTNEIAVVIDSNISMPLRPSLKILTDHQRKPLLNPFKFDLSSNPSVFITHIFS